MQPARGPKPPLPRCAAAPADPWEARATPAAVLLVAVLLLQGLAFIGESSQTSDEAAHLAAGYSYLTAGDFRLNREHPPLIKMLAALPLLALDLRFPSGALWEQAEEWNIGRIFVHENRSSNHTILFLGRLPVLLLGALLGTAIFAWGRRLFGPRGALLALALYVLDPNVVAHAGLVTTDLGITLFIFLTVWAAWRWSERPSPGRLLLAGLAAGGAFASKYTALWLLPILALLGAGLLLLGEPLPVRPWSRAPGAAAGGRTGARRIAALSLAALILAAPAIATLALCYGITGIGAYAEGLRIGLHHSTIGHNAYLLGRYSETGWWYYFLFAYLVKTPVGTLAVVALAMAWLGRRGGRLRPKDEIFIGLPIAAIVVITCFWKVNIGLRHLLPVYPFLYLSAGRLLAPRAGTRAPRLLAPAIAVCLAANALEAARIVPDHLAYFNPLAGGPAAGHRLLLDSNLDWGQGAKALRRFMEAERLPMIYLGFAGNSDPWYYGVRYQYLPGSGNLDNPKQRAAVVPDGQPRHVLVVSAMVLHALNFTDRDLYAWLRERRPFATPAHCYFAYEITGEAAAHVQVAILYLKFGLVERAALEAERVLRMRPGDADAHRILELVRREEARRVRPPGP